MGSPFSRHARFLLRAMGLVICLAVIVGCGGGQGSARKDIGPTEICLNGTCAPAARFSREQVMGALLLMFKANENSEAVLCSPESGSTDCENDSIGWFVQGGPIPGWATYRKPYITQVAFDPTAFQIKFKMDATVRWIGTPVFCTDAVTTVSMAGAERIELESDTACTWTAVPHVWNISYGVERVDFDRSLISGTYSVVGAGALTIGGGSGVFALRLTRENTLLTDGKQPGEAVLPSVAQLPPRLLAAPIPEKEAAPTGREKAGDAERSLWEAVSTRNTLESYRRYLADYPEGQFASTAQAQIESLEKREAQNREIELWGRIKESDNPADFREYLETYPGGLFVEQANSRRRRLEAATAEQGAIEAEIAFWEKVKGQTDPARIEAYLKRYPTGLFARPARERIAKLSAASADKDALEFKMWEGVKESRDIEDYQGFLQVFPESVFADIAKSRIDILIRSKIQAEETAFWNRIQESADPRDFAKYLERYPSGQYAETARQILAQLEDLKSKRRELELWRSVKDSQNPEDLQRYLTRYPAGRFAAVAGERRLAAERARAYSGIDFGPYHALVIGINDYRHLVKLRTAVGDAEAVAALLTDRYGFHVTLLRNAGRKEIIDVLSGFRRKLTRNENFLLYYAGHGWLDREAGRGYWLPADAERDSPANWISTGDISDTLKAIAAKHVIVIADSCYSGTLARAVKLSVPTTEYLRRMISKRARVVLTSGGIEPVLDTGSLGHSVFASAFLGILKKNRAVLEGTRLFSTLRESVTLNAPQTPEYSDLRFSGHEGGDFLFVPDRLGK